MNHDPLCPQYDCWLEGCTVCDECALIARVREDERRERIYVDAAISALWSTDYKFVPNTDALCDGAALIFIRDAVAAIEALGGKQ